MIQPSRAIELREQKPTVLLVDDDSDSLDQMVTFFSDHGWDAASATTVVDALNQAESRPFDLVVTEILIPERDGLELIIALRAKSATQPILAVSAGGRLAAGQVLRLAEALGANASLAKPLSGGCLVGLAASLI